MPNHNKQKGTRFENHFKHALQMLSFECIRAYSSIGTADLIFSPPWNAKKNSRALLVQCKDQKNGAYLSKFERDHMDNLQQRNSGEVIVAFKENGKCFIKYWETKEIKPFDKFIQDEYGILCNYSELLKAYMENRKPIHLYPIEKEIYVGKDGKQKEKPISSFSDFLSHNCWYPHVPENFK